MATSEGPKIAVVNHDAVFLTLLDKLLKTAGFQPILTPPGTAAHEFVADQQPQLIILDAWLDIREEGWNLIQTLRLDERTRHIPVLISTSNVNEIESRLQMSRNGQKPARDGDKLLHLIQKPFEPEELLDQILEIIA